MKVAIIGGGWLGQPLAHHLENIGHKVVVSKTNRDGVNQLELNRLSGFQLNLSEDSSEAIVLKLGAFECDTVIGCFPPGFRQGKRADYATWWTKLVKACQEIHVKRIVMVSSTTVYPALAQDMLEEMASLHLTDNNPSFSENARIMLQAEQSVKESGLSFAIVRCSGLTGPDRHPARFVPKLKQISDRAPANILHLIDAIGAVSFVAARSEDIIVNATTPNTTNKAQFYQAALNNIGSQEPLPPIVHDEDKHIVPHRLLELGYHFHFSHTLELL